MPSIAELTIDLHANVASLRNDLGKATRETQSFAKKIEGSFRGLRNIAGALGLTIGVQQIVSFAKGALDAAAGIGELAKQLGLSASALQELQFAASQSGVSGGELEAAFGRLTRSIGDAATGSKTAVAAFRAMGVSFADNTGKARSNEAVFLDIAEAYQNAGDKTAFAAQMADVLGKSASRLIPILEQGADGLAKNAQLARELGLVMSDELVAAADEAGDAMEMWSTRIRNYFAIGSFEALKFLGIIQRTKKEQLELQLQSLQQQRMDLSDAMKDAQAGWMAPDALKGLNEQLIELEENIRDVKKQLEGQDAPVSPAAAGAGGGVIIGGGSSSGSTATPEWLKEIRTILKDDSWKDKQSKAMEYTKIVNEATDETFQFGNAISGLTNDLVAAARGTMDFRDVLLNSLNDIFAGIAEGLMNLSTGDKSSMGGIGGIISSLIGAVAGSFAGGGIGSGSIIGGPGFGTPRAAGGPVSRGHPYMVGEEGPELFVPGQSGDIWPNGESPGGGAVVNNYWNFSGAVVDTAKIRAEIGRAMPGIARASEARISDQRRRGGLSAFR